MLFFLFGLPGAFADWCEAVTVDLVRRRCGPTALLHADTLEQIAGDLLESGAAQAVVSSRRPGGRLRAAVVQHRRDVILALDDPGPALADLVLRGGVELAAAIQAVAGSCAALLDYDATPSAVVLRRDRDWPWAAAIVGAIAERLQISLSADEIGELAGSCVPADMVERQAEAVAWWNGLSTGDQTMARGAIEPFIQCQETGDLPPITWEHALFFHGDRPQERVSGAVDITGRARCLLRGPDIMLPAGWWSLSLTVGLARAAAEHEFLVEIVADQLLGAGILRPQHQASAELTIVFMLGDETERPLQLRISTLRAAFDGAITIAAVILQRQAPATP
jgi:hypothetical protein